MMRILLLFFVMLSFGLLAQKEPKKNVFSNAGDATKMSVAKQKLYAGDYTAALGTYKDVEKNNPKNSSVKYYVAYCQAQLNQKTQAKEALLQALELNNEVKPETHLLLAQLFHEEENIDKALEHLDTYDKLCASYKPEAEFIAEAKLCRAQCNTAKSLMGNALKLTINSLGPNINSKYDDKNPCISADGLNLVFTTRRPQTTSSDRDVEGDGAYFEDIYISTLDTISKSFNAAVRADGSINTNGHDACTSISPDGKQIFIYKNDASKAESRGGNIFVSKVAGDKWKTPVSIGKPINSSYWEGGACLSPDGKRYFFSSERKGGYGKSDIWMVEKKAKNEWGKPENLGAEVNTEYDEAGMFLAPDGKTLFFCSNGTNSMGNYDIFKTVYENGKWSTPVNLGYPINTVGKEGQITLSADVRYAYLSSSRKGSLGESDVFMVSLNDYAILEKDGKPKTNNGLSILRGTIREGYEGYGLPDAEIKITNLENQEVNTALTNENGEYFFTIKGGQYRIDISKKGYSTMSEKIDVPMETSETPIVEKGYLLKSGL
jgi:Tol biopolymer transport system component/translation initiation factor 2 beta subunit (eIF-2beta)/eIF-5